jgi:hypothetical protein
MAIARYRNTIRFFKLPVASASATPLEDKVAVIVKLLNTMVVVVDYIDIAITRYRNTTRFFKLPITSTVAAPLKDEIAIIVKLLDPRVFIIGYIDIAVA